MNSQQIVYINSVNKFTGETNSNFKHSIVMNGEYDHACVLASSIPISYYMIQSGFNTFSLKEGLLSKIISLDIGNYSIISFSSMLKTALNANTLSSFVYDVRFSVSLGKISISVSNNNAVQPVITMIGTNLFKFFGFDIGSVNTFSSNTLTSTNVCQFVTEETLYIHTDLIENHTDNVLQEIYCGTFAPFSTVPFLNTCPLQYAKKITTTKNNIYNFYLLNENDEPINLNGGNMSMTILFFKKTDESLLKEYIKYEISK